jgi:hypothetical protein
MDVTLGLVLIASKSQEWSLTFIAVRCLPVRVRRVSNVGKLPAAHRAPWASTPRVPRGVCGSTPATEGVGPR